MSEIAKGLDNGLTNYGDQDFARYLRRSFAKSMGYTSESLDKPIVGICYTDSGFNNCHRQTFKQPESQFSQTFKGHVLTGNDLNINRKANTSYV